jgi:hypothetical protein
LDLVPVIVEQATAVVVLKIFLKTPARSGGWRQSVEKASGTQVDAGKLSFACCDENEPAQ